LYHDVVFFSFSIRERGAEAPFTRTENSVAGDRLRGTRYDGNMRAAIGKALEGVFMVDFREIEEATNYFAESNIVGRGGFGTVYKGDWKRTPVAVKRIDPVSVVLSLGPLLSLLFYELPMCAAVYSVPRSFLFSFSLNQSNFYERSSLRILTHTLSPLKKKKKAFLMTIFNPAFSLLHTNCANLMPKEK
jgi:hypothetical protein